MRFLLYRRYLNLTPYKKDMIFLGRQVLVCKKKSHENLKHHVGPKQNKADINLGLPRSTRCQRWCDQGGGEGEVCGCGSKVLLLHPSLWEDEEEERGPPERMADASPPFSHHTRSCSRGVEVRSICSSSPWGPQPVIPFGLQQEQSSLS
jgi:hypothetical protein